jgi:hypothetical protein
MADVYVFNFHIAITVYLADAGSTAGAMPL